MSDTQLDTTVSQTKRISLADIAAFALAAAFVVIVALEMPFYYALEFTKASNWFWSAVFMVSGCVAVAIMLMPDETLHAALTTALAMPGWLWGLIGVIGCAAAVAVSYAVSRHIWLRKEL